MYVGDKKKIYIYQQDEHEGNKLGNKLSNKLGNNTIPVSLQTFSLARLTPFPLMGRRGTSASQSA